MKRILTIVGTRPEAIKLAPLTLEFTRRKGTVEHIVCSTAQHRHMLDQVHHWFGIEPDIDLNLMAPGQKLADFAAKALVEVTRIIEEIKPDIVLVQGDTTTAMMAGLAAVMQRVEVGHVEAGLRTGSLYNPFPEELNRRVTGAIARYHFAPTERSAAALRSENVPPDWIHVTGNTVIDALRITLERAVTLDLPFLESTGAHQSLKSGRRLILVTAHRRESFGAPFESLCRALSSIADRNPDVELVYPVHLNPNVREPVERLLSGHSRIHLIEPLSYEKFVHLMASADILLTDSGGVQEEAPFLGKPTLVMRDNTERPEAIDAGTAKLVGTDESRIVSETEILLRDQGAYEAMARKGSPFGDGHAASRIADILLSTGKTSAASSS
jgi:UDP-N-acetylglucosamine 2-epimerase (non-hydrolysing)